MRGADAAAADFVHWEADLLDRGALDDWLALYADDAYYWIPLHPDQATPLSGPSHVYDTKDALMARVLRLQDPLNVTQQPPSRCSRLLGRVWRVGTRPGETTLGEAGDDATVVRATYHVAEALPHHDADQSFRSFAGAVSWCLVPDGPGFRIRWKRVDLINSEMGMYGVSIIL